MTGAFTTCDELTVHALDLSPSEFDLAIRFFEVAIGPERVDIVAEQDEAQSDLGGFNRFEHQLGPCTPDVTTCFFSLPFGSSDASSG